MALASDITFSSDRITCVRGARLVFHDLSFGLAAGDALVLTGPNGSGKSSLLRLLAGLAGPASGTIGWNGTDIAEDRQAHAARLHYVGHATGAKAALTTDEDLRFWALFRGHRDAGARDLALDRFGLNARADFPVRFLSSGQKRRLALARLIAVPAPLWLLDEPTVGLDSEGLSALEGIIAEHRAGNGIVVIASHTVIDLGGTHHDLDLRAHQPDGDRDLETAIALGLGGGA